MNRARPSERPHGRSNHVHGVVRGRCLLPGIRLIVRSAGDRTSTLPGSQSRGWLRGLASRVGNCLHGTEEGGRLLGKTPTTGRWRTLGPLVVLAVLVAADVLLGPDVVISAAFAAAAVVAGAFASVRLPPRCRPRGGVGRRLRFLE